MKEKKYAQACEAFEQSQRLDPQYGTQYNLAGCYVELGKLASAWNVYRELSRSDNNADRKQASIDAAAALEKRVPKLSLQLEARPDGIKLTLDGLDALAIVGVEAPVDLGVHKLVATAPGHKTWTKSVEVKEESKTVDVKIVLEEGSDPVGLPPPDKLPEGPIVETPEPSSKKKIGKIVTFTGAGITAVGLVFGGLAYSKWGKAQDSHDHPDMNLTPDEQTKKDNDIVKTARTYGNVSTVGVAVGLAAVAAGVFLWATSPDENATRVGAIYTGDSGGFAIAGRF